MRISGVGKELRGLITRNPNPYRPSCDHEFIYINPCNLNTRTPEIQFSWYCIREIQSIGIISSALQTEARQHAEAAEVELDYLFLTKGPAPLPWIVARSVGLKLH
jgi:hypothetical protein